MTDKKTIRLTKMKAALVLPSDIAISLYQIVRKTKNGFATVSVFTAFTTQTQ